MRRRARWCVLLSLVLLSLEDSARIGAQQPAGSTQAPGAPVPQSVPPPSPGPARDRPDAASRRTAIIRGQVLASDSGTPLRRATVRASEMGGRGTASIQTDAQGRFELRNLPPGRYVLIAERSGYVSASFGSRGPNRPGTPLELAEGQLAENLNFALLRAGAISGRIVDEFGEPISSANVQVLQFTPGNRPLGPMGSPGDRTDDLGQFRLFNLRPGEYYVFATFQSNDFGSPNEIGQSVQNDGYAPTYYPGTPNTADARRVTVRAGQDVSNVSFALSTARMGRISGKITASSGEPMVNGSVMIAPRDEGRRMGFGFGSTGASVRGDGSFQTSGLAPGTYTLTVQPNGFGNDPNAEMARVNVEVNGEDVKDLFIVTGRGGIIRGRVVTDDGSVPAIDPRTMRVFGQADMPGQASFRMLPGTVKPDWTFELTRLLDRVRVRWSSEGQTDGWTMRSALRDGVDLADTAVDVAPGQIIEDVEIVLTRRVTRASGIVTDDRNQPVTDASIIFFTDDRESWTFGSRYLRLTSPDTNGRYEVRLTPADRYRAIVVRGLENGQASDPEFLARALEYATPVDIREGETARSNLTLTVMP